jgi:hypothetical protein
MMLTEVIMEASKFIGKVLPDGHLSLPEITSKQVGKVFEVFLVPVEEPDIFAYTDSIAKEKKFDMLTEKDVQNIIHESRGVKCGKSNQA